MKIQDGIMRVWQGGRVDYDSRAILTIKNANRYPVHFLFYLIAGAR